MLRVLNSGVLAKGTATNNEINKMRMEISNRLSKERGEATQANNLRRLSFESIGVDKRWSREADLVQEIQIFGTSKGCISDNTNSQSSRGLCW